MSISTQSRNNPRDRRFRVDYRRLIHNRSPNEAGDNWDVSEINTSVATFTASLPSTKFQYISIPLSGTLATPATADFLEHSVTTYNPLGGPINDNNSYSIVPYLVDSIIAQHKATSPRSRSLIGAVLSIKLKFASEVRKRVQDGVLDLSVPHSWVSTREFIIDTEPATEAELDALLLRAIAFFEDQILNKINDVTSVNYDIDETTGFFINGVDISISNMNPVDPNEDLPMHDQQNNMPMVDDVFFAAGANNLMQPLNDPQPQLQPQPQPQVQPPNIQPAEQYNIDWDSVLDPDFEMPYYIGCGGANRSLLPTKLRTHTWMGPGESGDCFFEALAAHLHREEHGTLPTLVHIEFKVRELRRNTRAPPGPVTLAFIIRACKDMSMNLSLYRIVDTGEEIWKRAVEKSRLITKFPGPAIHLFKTCNLPDDKTEGPPIHHVILLTRPERFESNIFCGICSYWFTKTSRKTHEEKCSKCGHCGRPHNKSYDCSSSISSKSKRDRESVESDTTPAKRQRRRSVKPYRASGDRNAIQSYVHNKYFLDFETFTPPGGDRFVVYSYSLISAEEIDMVLSEFTANPLHIDNIQKEKFTYAGEDALQKCMETLADLPENSTIVTYNGSKFDLFFIFQYLVENSLPIHEILRKGKENKIITMCAGENKLKYWDMCLFTFGSLARVCESVGVPKQLQKKGFDHSSVKQWSDVHQMSGAIAEYNFYDVVCLGVAFKNFGEIFAEEFNQDITECCTLSQLAYKIWTTEYMTKEMCEDISLPTSGEDYKWMRRALFGGRCQPQQKFYKSRQCDYAHLVSNPDGGYADLTKSEKLKVFEEITDAKTYLDVSSLYPAASCKANMYPLGRYKTCTKATSLESLLKKFTHLKKHNPMNDDTGLSENKKKTLSMFTRSLLEVDVSCPTTINIPFLLERGEDGALIQNLLPKKNQVYDGLTLLMAQFVGYEVTHIHKRVTWERAGTPLDKFMTNVYKKKSEAAKGSAGYMVWKLLMNSLTGKMSQQWLTSTYSIHADETTVTLKPGEEMGPHELITHSETKEPIAIGVTINDPSRMPSKPIQMGVWILSISRIMMMDMYLKMNLVHSVKSMSAYGDTDSFLPPFSAYQNCMRKEPSLFGEKLGLLADEIGGGKIIRGWFISPKVYMVEYVTPDLKLKWKIRAKGIPRANKELDVHEYHRTAVSCQELIKWHTGNPLSRTLFSYEDEGKLHLADSLDDTMFEAMRRGIKVRSVYASMKRSLTGATFENNAGAIAFEPQCYRTVNEKDWWTSGARSNPGNTQNYSVPKGHYEFKKMNIV